MISTSRRSIRLVPELRAVHLERYHETTPAQMLYFTKNYDLGRDAIPPEILKVNLKNVFGLFWRSDSTILEMPEPLWVRFLPKGAVIAGAYKVFGFVRRRQRMIVTYAMENNDLRTLIGGSRRVPRLAVRGFEYFLGFYMKLMIDRIAYASNGSRILYQSIPFVASIENRTFEELPSAIDAPDSDAAAGTAIFVGILEPRKGIELLQSAWELVERRMESPHLTIVGPGPLSSQVQGWIDQSPSTREYLGQLPRTRVLQKLKGATVLVAPSLPQGRWREQIGLPIKEGLALGLTVVTTQQTGLADWLTRNGHQVVDVGEREDMIKSLAASLCQALNKPINRRVVRDSLPVRQGRYVSDEWLHRADGWREES